MPSQPPRFRPRGSKPPVAWAQPRFTPVRRKRGRAGQRARAEVIREEPLCRECLKKGICRPTEEVDHIVPLASGGKDERSNKQGLCKPCHAAKSAAERAAARRRTPPTP